LHLILECEDGEVRELSCTLAEATAQAPIFFDLLRARLEGITLASPVVGLRLGAERLEEGGKALSLFPHADPDPEILQVLIARLQALLGEGAVQQARVMDGYRYETRDRREPYVHRVRGTPSFDRNAAPAIAEIATMQFRPIEPQPVAVIVAQGAPALLGTPPKAVRDYAGPWRVDERGWSGNVACDDYDLVLEDGTICRVSHAAHTWSITGYYD